MLERIIKESSNEGSIVLDCFAGSGTTAAVAGTFVCTASLNLQKWRFFYGRWVTEDRLKKIKLQDIEIICLYKIKEISSDVLNVVK